MIKISLHKWVDHYLATLSPIIGHCILPPFFRWFCNIFCAYIFDVDYIFVWFTEKDILEIFDTRCQMACYKDGMNLHPTRSIWAGLRRWRGFERGKWGDLEILSKEELAQEPVSCLFQSVKPGWPLTRLLFTQLEEMEWNKSCPKRKWNSIVLGCISIV